MQGLTLLLGKLELTCYTRAGPLHKLQSTAVCVSVRASLKLAESKVNLTHFARELLNVTVLPGKATNWSWGQSGNENREGLGMRLISYLPCVAHASGRQTQTNNTGNCFDFCNLGGEKEEENDDVEKKKIGIRTGPMCNLCSKN